MLAQMMGMIDDAPQAVLRWMGRQSKDSISYESPEQMVAALRNPATEAGAVATMRKMHYGAFYGEKSRGMFSGLAERELLKKGKGWGGALFGRPVKGVSMGLSHLHANVVFAPLMGAVGAFTAKKGHKMSGLIGGTARGVAFGVGDAIGTALGGPMLGMALGSVTEKAGAMVEEGVQFLHDFNRNIRHINMGGNYQDSQIAYTMRQRAAQEMGSSVMNARQWLGKEAALMHQ